jgi:hypothetical protein
VIVQLSTWNIFVSRETTRYTLSQRVYDGIVINNRFFCKPEGIPRGNIVVKKINHFV